MSHLHVQREKRKKSNLEALLLNLVVQFQLTDSEEIFFCKLKFHHQPKNVNQQPSTRCKLHQMLSSISVGNMSYTFTRVEEQWRAGWCCISVIQVSSESLVTGNERPCESLCNTHAFYQVLLSLHTFILQLLLLAFFFKVLNFYIRW